MNINIYLSFDGNCEEALKFYETVLGAQTSFMMRYKDAPMESSSEWGEKVAHASFTIGTTTLMASDVSPDQYNKSAGYHVHIGADDPAKAEQVFNALAEDGIVKMPIQKTFWARAFGMLTDRFGIPWMVNCE
jgi:PhnB protein